MDVVDPEPSRTGCIAIIQSSYIPWKGYFDIIHDAETFIFLDDVRFSHGDWRNRNKIKTRSGSKWLTIPVGRSHGRLIHEVMLPDTDWRNQHWESITLNYSQAPFFRTYRPFFEEFYLGAKWSTLSEFNQALTRGISSEILGIKTRFRDSREFPTSLRKDERLIEILKSVGAKSYLSGPAAKSYIDPAHFEKAGIELVWKDYAGYPPYPQIGEPFEHGVTILDLIFSVGPDAPNYIWKWRES